MEHIQVDLYDIQTKTSWNDAVLLAEWANTDIIHNLGAYFVNFVYSSHSSCCQEEMFNSSFQVLFVYLKA